MIKKALFKNHHSTCVLGLLFHCFVLFKDVIDGCVCPLSSGFKCFRAIKALFRFILCIYKVALTLKEIQHWSHISDSHDSCFINSDSLFYNLSAAMMLWKRCTIMLQGNFFCLNFLSLVYCQHVSLECLLIFILFYFLINILSDRELYMVTSLTRTHACTLDYVYC